MAKNDLSIKILGELELDLAIKQLEKFLKDPHELKINVDASGLGEAKDDIVRLRNEIVETGKISESSVESLAQAFVAAGIKNHIQEITNAIWQAVEASMAFEQALAIAEKQHSVRRKKCVNFETQSFLCQKKFRNP